LISLVKECKKAKSPSRCIEVGAEDISKADKKAWRLLWSDCAEATENATTDSLDEVAELVFGNESVDGIVGPWRGVHRLTLKLDTELYQTTADEAKKQSEELTGKEQQKAMNTAIGLWCRWSVEHNIQRNVRFHIQDKFLKRCEDVRMAQEERSNSTAKGKSAQNHCLQLGAMGLSRVIREYRAGRIPECKRFVKKTAFPVTKLSQAVYKFQSERGTILKHFLRMVRYSTADAYHQADRLFNKDGKEIQKFALGMLVGIPGEMGSGLPIVGAILGSAVAVALAIVIVRRSRHRESNSMANLEDPLAAPEE